MKLTPVFLKRIIKEVIKGILILIIFNVALKYIIGFIGTSPGKPTLIINLIILVYIGIQLMPKKMYCSDCGNYLGTELNYSIPCRKCDGNIFSYTQVGAGKTFKHR